MRRTGLILVLAITNQLLLSEVQAGTNSSTKAAKGRAFITVEFNDNGVRIVGRVEHRQRDSGAQTHVAHSQRVQHR